ncbi:MAG: hypothetical protein MUP55_01745 [Candidatus Aenigmarchaeota archaeon]|nr:hypothetical protein [Candidatus Aenigmarchaeota archaeon]
MASEAEISEWADRLLSKGVVTLEQEIDSLNNYLKERAKKAKQEFNLSQMDELDKFRVWLLRCAADLRSVKYSLSNMKSLLKSEKTADNQMMPEHINFDYIYKISKDAPAFVFRHRDTGKAIIDDFFVVVNVKTGEI